MKKSPLNIRDVLITLIILALSFGLSVLLQNVDDLHEHITTVFVFAVFLISLLTRSVFYGIFASIVGMIAVDYAFTFPYYTFSFTVPVNAASAIVLTVISLLTSTLTMKLKQHAAMKAESERERMRANLLRAVSHDLRTPLTTIYGASTALLEQGASMAGSQREQMLRGIKEDAEWLIRMVENLLSVTRIDSGEVRILKSPTVLEELIDSVLVKFRKRYDRQEITIDLPEEMVIIPMDAILIEQVLVNLLENAVQHAAGMTELILRVTAADGHATFEIQDDGCGIPPERLNSLFTGYGRRSENVGDGRARNAGIGLSVCATIIHAHGGEITAENLHEGGAVFRFTLDTEAVDSDEQDEQ